MTNLINPSKVAKILKFEDSHLSSMSDEVSEGEDLSNLLDRMWNTMYFFKGLGLAACQIGTLKRVIIVHTNGFKTVLINPVIIKHRGRCTAAEECLSFPGKKVTRVRDKQIKVVGFDEHWKPVSFKLRNLPSRCVQHEIDHLNGVTIMNHENAVIA